MQTIVMEITNTFIDDAIAFMRGCGRIIVQIPMAPIDRLARACDVAGVLSDRASLDARQAATKRTPWGSTGPRSWRRRRHGMFSFSSLSDLT